jgi:hypothetical protein
MEDAIYVLASKIDDWKQRVKIGMTLIAGGCQDRKEFYNDTCDDSCPFFTYCKNECPLDWIIEE